METFVLSIVLIITIIIIFDISEKVDDFMEAEWHEVFFDHYINFIPFYINMLSPLFTFISVIFFTSKMASRYETVSILCAGASYRRLLRPYMIGATLICATTLYSSHFIIPKAARGKQKFEDKYINQNYKFSEEHIHRQIAKGEILYLESYNNFDSTGYKFALEKLKNGRQYYFICSDYIYWDKTNKVWKAKNYTERFFPNNNQITSTEKEKIIRGHEKVVPMDFSPKELTRIESKVDIMTYPELTAFIERQKEKGATGIERFEVENYRRTAIPFSTYILTLIGVALASRKIRGGIGLHLAIGLLLASTYVLFLHVSSTFAINGSLPPLVAVWLPNALYGIIAFFLVRGAQK